MRYINWHWHWHCTISSTKSNTTKNLYIGTNSVSGHSTCWLSEELNELLTPQLNASLSISTDLDGSTYLRLLATISANSRRNSYRNCRFRSWTQPQRVCRHFYILKVFKKFVSILMSSVICNVELRWQLWKKCMTTTTQLDVQQFWMWQHGWFSTSNTPAISAMLSSVYVCCGSLN